MNGKMWRQARTIMVLAVPPIVLLWAYLVFLKPLPLPLPLPSEAGPPAVLETIPEEPVKPLIASVKKYIVKAGDTLSAIAEVHHVDVDTLFGANTELSEQIKPGQELLILPQKGLMHTVVQGDTISHLAQLYGVKPEVILSANGKPTEFLSIGEKLFVPGGKRPERAETEVSRAKTGRMVWPTSGEISSPFGYRWGRLHAGLDIANDSGTPVKAALYGHVSYVGWISGYGKSVIVEHSQGYTTLYGHLSDYNIAAGQTVQAGQTIAYMGSTGNSTGPHLHFEVRLNGRAVNPLNLLP